MDAQKVEDELAKQAYDALESSTDSDDVKNETVWKIVQMYRAGLHIQNVVALAKTSAKNKSADVERKTNRHKAAHARIDVSQTISATTMAGTGAKADSVLETLSLLKWQTREAARSELARRPGSWSVWWARAVSSQTSKCTTCKSGVVVGAPLDECLRVQFKEPIDINGQLVSTMFVPPRCVGCGGDGVGARTPDENDPERARARKTALERKKRAWARAHTSGKLGADAADAAWAVVELTPESWRQRLIKDMCSIFRDDPRSPTARDLEYAALLAGDWPEIAVTLDDPRRGRSLIEIRSTHRRRRHDMGQRA